MEAASEDYLEFQGSREPLFQCSLGSMLRKKMTRSRFGRRQNTEVGWNALPAPGEAENAKGKFFGSVVEVLPLRGPLSLVEHDSVRRISTPNFPRNAK